MADFLLEIGLEEIPARMIDAAREELARRTQELLLREHLIKDGAAISFATPRRVSVRVANVIASQPDLKEEITGPSLKVAYKDGAPTPAAEAFAKKVGVDLSRSEEHTSELQS